MGGVVTQGGIETTYITAGRSKDIGNPYRRLTEQEIAQLQASVNDSYGEFVKHVAADRNLSEEKIRNDIGAMIFAETQAQKLGLIDLIGSKHDAFSVLAKRANVAEGDYKIVRQHASDDFLSTVLSVVTKQNQTPKAATQLCTLHSQVLAFHGSVASLCP
jgi:protease-4